MQVQIFAKVKWSKKKTGEKTNDIYAFKSYRW